MANIMEIAQKYADALGPLGELVGPIEDNLAGQEGFSLDINFPNGYGIVVTNNVMSHGGEDLSILRYGKLLDFAPADTGVPRWNSLELLGVDEAVSVAKRVAALPAPDNA